MECAQVRVVTDCSPSLDDLENLLLNVQSFYFFILLIYLFFGIVLIFLGATLELLNSLARNQTTDQPVIFLLELIGNDVCSGHPDFDHMTTVPEFRKNILAVLQKLDTMLPKGSHVAIMGLAKGMLLIGRGLRL